MQKKSATMIDRNAREGTGFVMITIGLGRKDDNNIIITRCRCRKSMMIHKDTLYRQCVGETGIHSSNTVIVNQRFSTYVLSILHMWLSTSKKIQ